MFAVTSGKPLRKFVRSVYIFADVETSGLSSKMDRVVSIAASCRGAEFSALVNL